MVKGFFAVGDTSAGGVLVEVDNAVGVLDSVEVKVVVAVFAGEMSGWVSGSIVQPAINEETSIAINAQGNFIKMT
jgi:hypothetical protein